MLSIIKVFKKFFSVVVFGLFFIGCQQKSETGHNIERYFTIQGNTQGTTYAIKYAATSEMISQKSIDSLLQVFDRSLSTYIPDSDVSKINQGDTTVVVDDYFATTFRTSFKIYEDTDGLFDPTIGVLIDAYGFGASKSTYTINDASIERLLPLVGFDKVKLTTDNKIVKTESNISFNFNAIAQGYAVDVVADLLEQKGIQSYMVEIGGELKTKGTNIESEKPWIVGIENPTIEPEKRAIFKKIKLQDLSMATSGNYRKIATDSVTGQKYVHIIHPKTGKANKTNILSVTIVTKNCIDADGYATALMLMSLEESKKFLAERPHLFGLIIYNNDTGKVDFYATENMQSLNVE
ncbi:MAG: FAD:protein FMN transferase [Flavobacterium sp.]